MKKTPTHIVTLLTLTCLILVTALFQAHAQTKSSTVINIDAPFKIARFVLKINTDPSFLKHPSSRHWMNELEKNLCWSGVFYIHYATTNYCRTTQPNHGLQLRLSVENIANQDYLRLTFTDNTDVQLFHRQQMIRDNFISNNEIMELINDVTKRVTGNEGILGSTVAFELKQPGKVKVITRTNTHGQEINLISRNQSISMLPSWKPDGTALVYTLVNRRGTQIVLDGLDGNVSTLAQYHGVNSGGTWSKDGKSLVVTLSKDGNADLYQVDLTGGRPKRLTHHPAIDTSPSISPDGNYLLFVSDRSGSEQIYVLYLPTNEIFRLTFTGTRNTDPQWNPDGTLFAFTRTMGRHDQVYIRDLFGDNERALTTTPWHSETPEWSPDGRQVVFSANRTGEYKLYVMFIDGTGLRRLTQTAPGFAETSPSWTLRRF